MLSCITGQPSIDLTNLGNAYAAHGDLTNASRCFEAVARMGRAPVEHRTAAISAWSEALQKSGNEQGARALARLTHELRLHIIGYGQNYKNN